MHVTSLVWSHSTALDGFNVSSQLARLAVKDFTARSQAAMPARRLPRLLPFFLSSCPSQSAHETPEPSEPPFSHHCTPFQVFVLPHMVSFLPEMSFPSYPCNNGGSVQVPYCVEARSSLRLRPSSAWRLTPLRPLSVDVSVHWRGVPAGRIRLFPFFVTCVYARPMAHRYM